MAGSKEFLKLILKTKHQKKYLTYIKILKKLGVKTYFPFLKRKIFLLRDMDLSKAIKVDEQTFINSLNERNIIFKKNEKLIKVNSIKKEIEQADNIMRHQFKIFNKTYDLNRHVFNKSYLPWHYDFETLHEWNSDEEFDKIGLYPNKDIDVLRTWRLSSFRHLPVLGCAFYLTEENSYLYEIQRQLEDWINKNPLGRGINWKPMVAALRLVNWLVTWELIQKNNTLNQDFLSKFFLSIIQHACYIRYNLEWSIINNNHYLVNIFALYYYSVIMEGLTKRNWLSFSEKEIEKEFKKQFNSDGINFEGSVGYHVFSTEILIYYLMIKKACFKCSDKELNDLAYKALYYIKTIMLPDGTLPNVGDSSNEHLIDFNKDMPHHFLLNLGACFLDVPELKTSLMEKSPELQLFNSIFYPGSKALNVNKSIAFKKSGDFIIRDGNRYFYIANKKDKYGLGGHFHNDKLSFVMAIGNDQYFVDPGTYCYGSNKELRNLMRSNKSHNTVTVNNKEQNRFIKGMVFFLHQDAEVKCIKWVNEGNHVYYSGEHTGYVCKDSVIHQRSVNYSTNRYSKGIWEIFDYFYSIKNDSYQVTLDFYFVLHPERRLERLSPNEMKVFGNSSIIKFVSDANIEIKEAFYSPCFGVLQPTKQLHINKTLSLPNETKFIIVEQ